MQISAAAAAPVRRREDIQYFARAVSIGDIQLPGDTVADPRTLAHGGRSPPARQATGVSDRIARSRHLSVASVNFFKFVLSFPVDNRFAALMFFSR